MNRLEQDKIKLRIQRSANENSARIQKFKAVNSLIEKIYKEAQAKIVAVQARDQA